MSERNMKDAAAHLADAAMHVVHVTEHVKKARDTDPDPEVADEIYTAILNNLKVMALHMTARVYAGMPEIERMEAE